MPSDDVAEFGGWPRPPRWVSAVAWVAAAAVLVAVVVARAGLYRAASSRPGPLAPGGRGGWVCDCSMAANSNAAM